MILVTGVAGFIGSEVGLGLLKSSEQVLGVDSMNAYYETSLKSARLARLTGQSNFRFLEGDISDRAFVESIRKQYPDISRIVHLAAQAGVRYSIENPYVYTKTNVDGQLCMLELARQLKACEHFVYASSSSVYGLRSTVPFSAEDATEKPVSVYAATKKAAELLAHCYGHLYRVPTTGLRLFTVYGPWGRPDMAAFLFTKSILEGKPVRLFNSGKMTRDFTYIDDVVAGILTVLRNPPNGNFTSHNLYNLGNQRPEKLIDFIRVLEKATGRSAVIEDVPMQPGDVQDTYADVGPLQRDLGFAPSISIEEGLPRFVEWYRNYYGV